MINDNSQSSLNATQDDYEINLAEIFSIIWKFLEQFTWVIWSKFLTPAPGKHLKHSPGKQR